MSADSINLLFVDRNRKNAAKPGSAAEKKHQVPIRMFADGSVEETLSHGTGFQNEALFGRSCSMADVPKGVQRAQAGRSCKRPLTEAQLQAVFPARRGLAQLVELQDRCFITLDMGHGHQANASRISLQFDDAGNLLEVKEHSCSLHFSLERGTLC